MNIRKTKIIAAQRRPRNLIQGRRLTQRFSKRRISPTARIIEEIENRALEIDDPASKLVRSVPGTVQGDILRRNIPHGLLLALVNAAYRYYTSISAFAEFNVEGLDRLANPDITERPVIFMAPHRSYFDPKAISIALLGHRDSPLRDPRYFLPLGFMAKSELFRGAKATVLPALGGLPFHREEQGKRTQFALYTALLQKRLYHNVIFPEATIPGNVSGEKGQALNFLRSDLDAETGLLQFSSWLTILALAANALVYPIGTTGIGAYRPPEAEPMGLKAGRARKHAAIEINIGEPIDVRREILAITGGHVSGHSWAASKVEKNHVDGLTRAIELAVSKLCGFGDGEYIAYDAPFSERTREQMRDVETEIAYRLAHAGDKQTAFAIHARHTNQTGRPVLSTTLSA